MKPVSVPAAAPALVPPAASGAMFTGVECLQGLVAGLPGPAQGPVQNAINRVTGVLSGLFGDPFRRDDDRPRSSHTHEGRQTSS